MNKSLTNAGESIARSTQIAIETEQIGNDVLGELNDQGERLTRTNERVCLFVSFIISIFDYIFYVIEYFHSWMTQMLKFREADD